MCTSDMMRPCVTNDSADNRDTSWLNITVMGTGESQPTVQKGSCTTSGRGWLYMKEVFTSDTIVHPQRSVRSVSL